MQDRKSIFGMSSVTLVIILGAAVKFALHILTGAKYGFFYRRTLHHCAEQTPVIRILGIACLTKMTLLYIGPGFLVALLLSKFI
jgi:hypothetical protein